MRTKTAKSVWAVALLALLAPFSRPASGSELCGMPSLQQGPIGDGWGVASFGLAELETELGWQSASGVATSGAYELKSEAKRSTIGVAGGFDVTPSFRFTTFAQFASETYSESSRSSLLARASQSSDRVEFGGGPSLWLGSLLLGGRASVLSLGEENSHETTKSGSSSKKVAAATIPLLRVFGAVRSGNLTWIGRAKLYNDARSTTHVTDEVDEATVQETRRKSPAESSVDAVWQRDSLKLALGLTYFSSKQGAADPALAQDSMALAVGGYYQPQAWFGVAGAFQYREPSYRDERYASFREQNLGGPRLDVGWRYNGLADSLLMSVGYVVPSAVSYDSAAGVDDRGPESGGKVTAEQGIWDVKGSVLLQW